MKKKSVDPKIELDNLVEKEIQKILKSKHHKCMFKGCNFKAIGSHAISESISLRQIAESNWVKSPKAERKYPNKKYFIDNIGAGKASVFNGFCEKHEKLFNEIDSHPIQTEKEALSQVYRSLSYMLSSDSTYLTAQRYVHNKALTIIKSDIVVNAMKKIDEGLARLELLKDTTGDYLSSASEDKKIGTEPVNYIPHPTMIIILVKLDYQIPVAINTKVSYKNGDDEFELFVTSIPYANSTDFLLMIDARRYLHVKNEIDYNIASHINLLSYIERLLMMSDHWWIRPSIIDNFSEEKKQIILDDLYNYAGANGNYDISIFDEIRLRLITDEPRYDNERKKIYELPDRAPFEIRSAATIQKIVSTVLRSKEFESNP